MIPFDEQIARVEAILAANPPLTNAALRSRIAALENDIASTQKYAASVLHELSEAKAEINRLQDIVVTYGDRVRMATSGSMEWQQAIDRAFDRER